MSPPEMPTGYESKTITFKNIGALSLELDIMYPRGKNPEPVPVLIHYHGGFLVVGDKYSFMPYWLLNACASRKWIFVTPDYRLIPEATAHEAVADALDAYNWVRQSLSQALGMKIGPVISAGSSAGAYLALTSASMTSIKPDALVLIYGMLDPISERYTKPGTNIFGMPPIDSQPLLDQWNLLKEKGETTVHTGYPVPRDPANDFRMGLITALHCMALFPDFMTGVPGLGRDIAQNGTSVVPAEARQLYTIAFERGTGLPRTAIFHGKNDLAVPFSGSEAAADSLRKLGVVVHTEFPDDAPHSFDSMAGNVDLEDSDDTSTKTPAFDGLRGIVKFLDSVVAF